MGFTETALAELENELLVKPMHTKIDFPKRCAYKQFMLD